MKNTFKQTVGAVAVMVGLTSAAYADQCCADKAASAGTCAAGKDKAVATGTCPFSKDQQTSTGTCAAKKDLVAVAKGSENFKTLVAAIQAAGLVEVLQGEGPYTVFAPTDAAFAKLPAGTVDNLLKPENREKLIAILKYHVVPGKVLAADVKTMQASTANGQKVNIKVSDAGVSVDNAKVIKTDLLADNGVIHVIDTVILPRS